VIFFLHKVECFINELYIKRKVVDIIGAVLEVFLYDDLAFYHAFYIGRSVK